MRGIRIGTVFGIPIRLDFTFLLVLPFFAYLIGADVANFTETINSVFGSSIAAGPLASSPTSWYIGTAAAVGLFVGVLLHEFGHSLVARRFGFEIESITLWLFGGVARFTEIPENWKQEFYIAIAGPVVSVLIGVVSYVGFLAIPSSQAAVKFVFGYLAMMNVLLAVFNMLPGFPMDGGRVLRALLARNRPHARATQIAAEVGKVFAFLLGIVGLVSNLFLIALAFFIYIGASSEAQQTVMKAAFENVVVRDIMTAREDLHTVTEQTSVAELMQQMFRERHTGYPVMRNGNLVGMVTLNDARAVNEVERDAYRVDDVMTDDITSITPDAGAMDALATMQEHNVGRLPVIDVDGELVGLVSRTDLMTAFDIIQTTGSLNPVSATDAVGERSSPSDVR